MKTYCIQCDKEVQASMETFEDSLSVRGEHIYYIAELPVCKECGAQISNSKQEANNLERAYDAYREKHSILKPAEITELRKSIDLSLREFSKLLGFGEQTIARYERGGIPDESHSYVINQVRRIEGLRELLERNRSRLSDASISKIESYIESNRRQEARYASITLPFIHAQTPCSSNGYRVYDYERVKALAGILAAKCRNLYKTKFQKAMFLCDMLTCEKLGRSLTGLQYAHADYGPIIDQGDMLLQFLTNDSILKYHEKEWGEVLTPGMPGSAEGQKVFAEDELQLVKEVVKFVNGFSSASELSDFSHSLSAWKNTKNGEVIPYNFSIGEVSAALSFKG